MNIRSPIHFCAFLFSFFAISIAVKSSTGRACGTTEPAGLLKAALAFDSAEDQTLPESLDGGGLLAAPDSLRVPIILNAFSVQIFKIKGAREFVVRTGLSPPPVIV